LNDDALVFAEDSPDPGPPDAGEPWRVLVVDDEPHVHSVTMLALAGLEIDERPIALEHALSAEQAREKLLSRDDWALVLLDVVMESEDAGLRLARWLREECGNRRTRIVVRTGQPGVAPERDVMRAHDIDDYQPKAELSAQRLQTAVLGGIRAWRDLQLIAEQRADIERLLERQGELLRAFSRFVPLRMLRALGRDNPADVSLGDQVQRDMTLLFLDVRGFTRIAEGLGPQRTFALLNRLFGELLPIVHAHSGSVDKFLGDGLLAIFDAPASAVRASYGMLERLDALAASDGIPPELDVGIGVHCGPTVLGVVGSEERFETTVVADSVNVAARLEHLTRDVGCRIVVSEDVFRRLPESLQQPAEPLGPQAVRGRLTPVTCFGLLRVLRRPPSSG
jgi:class 3 adenylate cyclase